MSELADAEYTHAQVRLQLVTASEGRVEQADAQVPLQPNFSDCGLYLVHYARGLLTEPERILQFVQVSLDL